MSFKIERANNPRSYRPDGFFIFMDGVEWNITDLTISASGKICLKLHDYVRKENQIKTLCSLEELIKATVEGAEFRDQ
jgi:hypothetical protein